LRMLSTESVLRPHVVNHLPGVKHPYPRRRANFFCRNPPSPADFWPVTLQECEDPATVLNPSTLRDNVPVFSYLTDGDLLASQ